MIKIKHHELIQLVGKKVRFYREQKKLSQEQLAFLADVPISQIGRIERGEINPTISSLFVVAKAFKISLPELVDVELEE